MRRFALLALALLGCTDPYVLGEDRAGATTLGGGPGLDVAWGVAVDANGNSYTVGEFESSLRFEGGEVHDVGLGPNAAFLASHDPAGRLRWSRSWSSTGGATATDVRVDGNDVYVVGYARGLLELDGVSFDTGAGQALTVLFFDTEGTTVAPLLGFSGTGGNVQGKSIDTRFGRLAVVGHYVGDVDLGGGPIGATPDRVDNGLISVFEADNTLRWSDRLGGADVRLATASLESNGGLYVAGGFRGADLPGLTNRGGWDGLLVALDSSGGERWSAAVSSAGDDRLNAIIDDGSGVVVAGRVWAEASLGATSAFGGGDGFVARYGADGTLRWARRFGGSELDELSRVAITADGGVIAAGHFRGEAEFSGTSLVSRGESDIVVIGLGPDGTDRWARRFGGPGDDQAWGIASDGAEVILVGWASDNAEFGEQALRTDGSEDVVVHRFTP